MNHFLDSKKTRIALWIIGGAVIVLLAFGGGMAVGYQRGIFASRFGENYYNNFRGGDAPIGGMPMMPGGAPPMNQHGTAGKVIDVNASSSRITVTDVDGDEESIVVDANTAIKKMDQTISFGEITVGDQVVVIGEPNGSGQILARFIRIFSGSSSLPQMPPQGQ
jgi:ribosomal protein L21E